MLTSNPETRLPRHLPANVLVIASCRQAPNHVCTGLLCLSQSWLLAKYIPGFIT